MKIRTIEGEKLDKDKKEREDVGESKNEKEGDEG